MARSEPAKGLGKDSHTTGLYIGLDIGSSFVHCVVLDGTGQVLYSAKPLMHFANPPGAVAEAWQDVLSRFDRCRIISTAFTGVGAKALSLVAPDVVYLYESVAIPKGVAQISPQAKYIFHIGAKDSYFFDLTCVDGQPVIQEWQTGTKCGGGSGTLIEKQCRRVFQGDIPHPELEDPGSTQDLFEREQIRMRNRGRMQQRIEQMFSLAQVEAARSKQPSEFLARCGVVVQSDLIHKQNEGATRVDNLAGLFRTVARNYKVDVLGARTFRAGTEPGYAQATGGVMATDLVKDYLSEVLGIPIGRSSYYQAVAAIGAAVKAMEDGNRYVFALSDLDKAAEHSRQTRQFAPPLSASLGQVREKTQPLSPDIPYGIDVVIGIDGGSTTTKGALVEVSTGRLLDKLYIKTHGDPEGSLKKVLRYLARHKDKVRVLGTGATGSARKLYEKVLLSKKKAQRLMREGVALTDRVTDEITCHAMGVRHFDPATDTIFEIGGQDMKFTAFGPDGTVREAKMNYSCQAGSGQTLDNMAEIINLNVEDTLQEAALRAKRVPMIDSTCGVFMEMDENRLIAEGFSKDEIAAAIIRGTAASYYYKFVGGSQHVGKKCSAQGGPPLGKAFLAALAQVTGGAIEAYPHREMFGAWGQALDIIKHIQQLKAQGKAFDTAFRGWDLVDMPFNKKKVACRDLFADKSCGTRDCTLELFSIEDDQIITGGFCPRGNSEAVAKPKTNYVDKYHRIFEKHIRQYGLILTDLNEQALVNPRGPTIGIKRSTATLGEKGVWAAALLRQLGFCPVMSPVSDSGIAKQGVDLSRTEFCVARKLATGHAAVLHDHPLVEYLFNPSFIEHRKPERPNLKYCIYTESEGYVLNDVLSLNKAKQLNPILHFGDIPLLTQEIQVELTRVGRRFTTRQIESAVGFADQAEQSFREEIHAEGDKFLARIEKDEAIAYVGIGRDYVLLDPEASSNSGEMFSQVRGLDYIPQIFLEHRFMDLPLTGIVENEFWVESVKILRAHLYVAGHANLFGIRMMNFACGPDSLKIYQERKMHEVVGKPLLVLVTDAQTNNAPFVTRTEAHERVVAVTQPRRLDVALLQRCGSGNHQADRIWLIPFMGPASIVGSAGLRHFGIRSQVLPTNTQRGYDLARKHISTEVCHPLKGVVGDALGFLRDQIDAKGERFVKDNYLVMLPTTSGPCRFGKYTELVREFLDKEGLQEIPVVGPSAESDYVDVPFPSSVGLSSKMKFQQVLFRGIKAGDLLEDTFLRFRPYARDKEAITRLRHQRLQALERLVEEGARVQDLVRWGHETVDLFKSADLDLVERFPLVLYIGEIYMRQHDPYTGFVIDRLEDTGLELVRDPVTDWLDYVNKVTQRDSRRDMGLGFKHADWGRLARGAHKFGQSHLKGWYMSRVEDRIAEPFHEVLEGRHGLPKPMDMIETLEKNHECHADIEGESPLSTGIAYHIMHDLVEPKADRFICGIFHVGPFTCMQESVATAKIEAMVKEYRKKQPALVFPIIHAFFGDSPNSNLESEIAVFHEQCYQKRDLLKRRRSRVAPMGL